MSRPTVRTIAGTTLGSRLPRKGRSAAYGFTLVELLVTITIIGILASVALGVMGMAKETARVARTRALVAKIDRVIAEQWQSYQTRRVRGLPVDANRLLNHRYLVNARRELMRMEMPDRWSDVTDNLGATPIQPRTTSAFLPNVPGKTYSYLSRANEAKRKGATPEQIRQNGAAELLYLIVANGPYANEFNDRDRGDIDGDGLFEFHDAWGRPIRFLLWPAGYLAANAADTEIMDPSVPDPFDTLRVIPGGDYAMYPLIYSAGPDGIYDVNIGKQSADPTGNDVYSYRLIPDSNPPVSGWPGDWRMVQGDLNSPSVLVGTPLDGTGPDGESADGQLSHYDNIHNHRLESTDAR